MVSSLKVFSQKEKWFLQLQSGLGQSESDEDVEEQVSDTPNVIEIEEPKNVAEAVFQQMSQSVLDIGPTDDG